MLYSPVIRDRFRSPRFSGRLDAPGTSFEDVNPLCGDRIRIECRMADGRVTDARFSGDSCAICLALADILLELAIGRPEGEARAIGTEALLERLAADIRPSRMRCVTLPLSVLRGALERRQALR